MLLLAILFFILFIVCGSAALKPQQILSLAGVDLRSLSKQERASLESSWPVFLGVAAVACALVAAFCMHQHELSRAEAPLIEARQAAREEKTRKYGVGSLYKADSPIRREVDR